MALDEGARSLLRPGRPGRAGGLRVRHTQDTLTAALLVRTASTGVAKLDLKLLSGMVR